MKEFMEYAPFLVPYVIIEIGLAVAALIHVLRHRKYRFGNRVVWILIVCLIQIIGPVVYFTVGRGEE